MRFIDALTKAYVDMGIKWKRESYFYDTREEVHHEQHDGADHQYNVYTAGAACMLGAAAIACADGTPWNSEPALKLTNTTGEIRPGFIDEVAIVAANLFGHSTYAGNEDMDELTTEELAFVTTIPGLNDNEFWAYLMQWWEDDNPYTPEMVRLRDINEEWLTGEAELSLTHQQNVAYIDYKRDRNILKGDWLDSTNHIPTLLQWMQDAHPDLCEFEVCAVGGKDC